MTDEQYLRRLGLRIKEVRTQKGLSQMALAARCNLAKANLSRIESGKTNLTLLTLRKLCRELRIELVDLVVEI